MKAFKKIKSIVRNELDTIESNLIIKKKNNEYKVFGKYRITTGVHQFKVYSFATEVGVFHSTRAALSWCVADKYKQYSLAAHLLALDNRIHVLKNDILVRVAIAEKSKKSQFFDELACKIESKVIRRVALENELARYINLAKYQYKGNNNEINRTVGP